MQQNDNDMQQNEEGWSRPKNLYALKNNYSMMDL